MCTYIPSNIEFLLEQSLPISGTTGSRVGGEVAVLHLSVMSVSWSPTLQVHLLELLSQLCDPVLPTFPLRVSVSSSVKCTQ